MALRPARTAQFKRDYKLAGKRGRDLGHLNSVIAKLIAQEKLGQEYGVHPLKGKYKGLLECHVGGDFLLVWQESDTEIVFIRTGTHVDIFGR